MEHEKELRLSPVVVRANNKPLEALRSWLGDNADGGSAIRFDDDGTVDSSKALGALENVLVPTTAENKIEPAWIATLMDSITYHCDRTPGTTQTYCAAVLHRFGRTFVVGEGTSGCVDPANFDPAVGADVAQKNAEANARNFLWRAEGYRLFWQLFGGM